MYGEVGYLHGSDVQLTLGGGWGSSPLSGGGVQPLGHHGGEVAGVTGNVHGPVCTGWMVIRTKGVCESAGSPTLDHSQEPHTWLLRTAQRLLGVPELSDQTLVWPTSNFQGPDRYAY